MGPILTVLMSLSLAALIFSGPGPVYCCNSTTIWVEDQCNYDDVEHDNCDEGGNYDHDYGGDINDFVDGYEAVYSTLHFSPKNIRI